jgi:hypothetical protein
LIYDDKGQKLIKEENEVLSYISDDVNYQNDPFISDDHNVGWYPIAEQFLLTICMLEKSYRNSTRL